MAETLETTNPNGVEASRPLWRADGRASTGSRDRSPANWARPWPRLAVVALAASWLVVGALLTVLSVAAHLYPSFPLDRTIMADFGGLRASPEAPGMNFVGDLAGPAAEVVAYLIILGTMLILRLFREAVCTAVAGLGAELGNILVNGLVARPRPPMYHGHTLLNLGSHSYPSGHTANALGLYGFLFYLCLVAAHAHPRWRGWLFAAQIVLVVFIVDVGISRVLEQQHWPADVFAGYLLGALTLTLGIALYHRLSEPATSGPALRPTSARPTSSG